MDVEAETAKAMSRPYWKRFGNYRPDPVDEPISAELEAAGEWQDAVADRLYDEPGDPLLDWDDVPAGYDPTWWKAGL